MKKKAEPGHENINIFHATLIVEELTKCGVELAVISPGSRSTPLAIACARNSALRKHVIVDERAAAFFAAGYARYSQKPAVLICTSGTAVANYLPALTECNHDGIPVIVLSADRPVELLDNSANQSIDQKNLLRSQLNWFFEINMSDRDLPPKTVISAADYAWFRSMLYKRGPVQINCQFREPLAPVVADHRIQKDRLPDRFNRGESPFTSFSASSGALSNRQVEKLIELFKNNAKGLFVVSRFAMKQEQRQIFSEQIIEIAKAFDYPIFADVTSGFRGSIQDISYFDLVLMNKEFSTEAKNHRLLPDVIILLGAAPVSKRLLKMMHQAKVIISIQTNETRVDPETITNLHIKTDIVELIDSIYTMLKQQSWPETYDYSKKFLEASNRIEQLLEAEIELTSKESVHSNDHKIFSSEINEYSVFYRILQRLSAGDSLFLASSMPVRFADMLFTGPGKAVAANRGASGIDGVIASAAGFATSLNFYSKDENSKKDPVILITGDLSTIHDLNSLYLVSAYRLPVLVLIINNHGGGIFSYLPIAAQKEYLPEYFKTEHKLNFEYAAKMFNLPYNNVKKINDCLSLIDTFRQNLEPIVIEIETNHERDIAEIKLFFNSIQQAELFD